MKKTLVTIIIVAIGVFAYRAFTNQSSDALGSIQIIIVDQSGDYISNDTYYFEENDTLFGILDENYTLGCANNNYSITDDCSERMFGRVLLKIDSIETDWFHYFIAIYINDEYSTLGIDDIPLHDQDVYRFEYTKVGEQNDN